SIIENYRGRKDIQTGRMFGSTGLKVAGKVFAMVVKGSLVVKLPADRAAMLVASKEAGPFDPGHGRVMKEWVAIGATNAARWSGWVSEALEFVSAGSKRGGSK